MPLPRRHFLPWDRPLLPQAVAWLAGSLRSLGWLLIQLLLTLAIATVMYAKGEAAAEADSPPEGMKLVDFSSDLKDFADTAALMWCMDLVVTCDTSVAHAAGAMGVKTHVLLPHNPDWRWHLGRTDSPWYPTLTLHRQPNPDDYDTPIRNLTRALLERH